MDERARRIGENEALFRTVNDRIHDVAAGFVDVLPSFEVVCECGDPECTDRFAIDVATYERIRADPTAFVMRPGHQKTRVEYAAETGEGWIVVRKLDGAPAELAEETSED